MACEDQITTQNLIDAKSDAITLGEVATSKAGAVSAGAPITESTNRFGLTTDTVQGRLNKLGIIFSDPIDDWTALTLISDLRAHRFPATTGEVYIPVKPLPFTTGATFNTDDWVLYNGVPDDLTRTKPTIAAFKADDDLVRFVGGFVSVVSNDNGLTINSVYEIFAGHATDDSGSILNSDTGTLFHGVLQVKDRKVTFAQFNAAQDGGTTDDTAEFVNLLAYQLLTGVTIDGENRTTRLTGTQSLAPTMPFFMQNWDIITGNDYTDQLNLSFTTDVEQRFSNISVDGERDTRAELEPWTVFATFAGVDSITPLGVGSFIKGNFFLTKDVHLSGLKFTNCHYQECIEINSHATVWIDNFKASFCSNKTYHIWHSDIEGNDPDTGMTIANNIDTRNCGIMQANFLVDAVAKVRADNFAPQGSFGAIVTFGRYISSNIYVNNYGSTAVTGDRNKSWTCDNLQVLHTDANAFSNNSSGAYWNESCSRATGNNIEIKVTARDSRETALDNSLLQIFLSTDEVSELSNVILETEAGANINKDIRGSLGSGSNCSINGFSVDGVGSNAPIVIANTAGQSSRVSITHGRVRGGKIEIKDSLNTVMTDIDHDGLIDILPTLGVPIGDVFVNDVSGTQLLINGCDGKIKVNACNLTNLSIASASGSSFEKLDVGGGTQLTGGTTTINGGISVKFGFVETKRRIDFIDVERVLVVGGEYKTDIGETILNFAPTGPGIMIHAAVMATAMWIKTGTGGAGFIAFNGDVGTSTDTGNDKQTMAFT